MNYKRYGKKVLRSVISASPKQLWRALMDTVGEECFSGMSRPRAVLPTSEIFHNEEQDITVNYNFLLSQLLI